MKAEIAFDENAGRLTAARMAGGRVPEIKFQLIPFDKITMSTSSLYRVKGLLPEQGTGSIWGAYGEFKSFWLYDLCMHVAQGWTYRGEARQRRSDCPLQL